MSKKFQILLVLCTALFCAESGFGQKDTSYSCAWSKQWLNANPQTQNEAIVTYDSLRLYVEKCAAGDDNSYEAFSPLSSAVQLYAPDDNTRYDRFRDWLISVLYLNKTSPYYFCNCMAAIMGTYGINSQIYPNHNGALAVLNYLRGTNCDDAALEREYLNSINSEKQHGEDTTLPPLDSIGLGFLLHHQTVSPVFSNTSQYLTALTSSPNPFKKETTLEFTLNRMAYVQLAIYDELGRLVWGDGRGSSLGAGSHQIQIDGSKFPGGTLYARIATGFGEVKTVKLIHD